MTVPTQQAWSLVAREYARNIVPGFAPAARALCALADVCPGDHVVDIACGPGTLALVAKEMGAARVIGVDFAPDMVAVAREAAKGIEGIEFIEGDAVALPLEDGHFDVALSNFGMIFAPDPVSAVREMARVLRPGGRGGLTAWLRAGTTDSYYEHVYRHIPRTPSSHDPYDWGESARATAWFEQRLRDVEITVIDVPFLAESPAAAWRALSSSTGRVGAAYPALDPGQRARMDRDMIGYFERYRREDGRVLWPREALAVIGRK